MLRGPVLLSFNFLVFFIIYWAGYQVGRQSWGSSIYTSLAGPVILFSSLVLVMGSLGVITVDPQDLTAILEQHQGSWMARRPNLAIWLAGVLGFLVLSPVAIIASLLGGLFGGRSMLEANRTEPFNLPSE